MSDSQDADDENSPPVARNFVVDSVSAVLLFVIGLVVVIEARRLGAGWTSDGPGSGYFPFYIGLIICISSLGILVQALSPKTRDSRVFVNRQQLRRVTSVLLPAALYVGLITFLGFYIASALYIAVFMIVLGKYAVLKSVTVGLIVNVFFFAMFEVWFKVPLFKGKLDLLGFLGY